MNTWKFQITIPRNIADIPESGIYSLQPGKGLLIDITLDKIETPAKGRMAPILLPFSQDPVHEHEDFVDTISLATNGKETVRKKWYFC